MAIQIQVKVLPNPSGEVVRINAGGQNLVGGTANDSTVVEFNPGDKIEITGEIEERVVVNPEQMAATKVPVHDVDGRKSFEREKEEAQKLAAGEEKKRKEEVEKKWEESRKREAERTGRPLDEDDKSRKEREERERSAQATKPTGGERVAGNVTGSKEVRDEPGQRPAR